MFDIHDDDGSVLSQQAPQVHAAQVSFLQPGVALEPQEVQQHTSTCEYDIVHDVPNSPKSTTRVLLFCKGLQVCSRWLLIGPTQHRKCKASERLMSMQSCRLGYKQWLESVQDQQVLSVLTCCHPCPLSSELQSC